MGWNQGYTIFEATVIGCYDQGVLTKKVLSVLMEPYRGSDIDCGGSCDLLTHDGKGVEQVVIETLGMKLPPEPPKTATEDERDAWYEKKGDLFNKVRSKFGWR